MLIVLDSEMMQHHVATRPVVLVVEDEVIVAADLTEKLRRLGYEVGGIAHRGTDAIGMAAAAQPALVLMDILLPGGMDGITAATEIQSRWNIPIVFVTANEDESVLERAKEANPVGFLTKPFRTEELRAALAVALHQHDFTRRLFEQRAWLETILGSIRDGVIATDAEGRISYMNAAAETLTGWSRSAAFARPIEEVYRLAAAEGDQTGYSPVRQALASNRETERVRVKLYRANGDLLMVEDKSAPIHDPEGRLAGAVKIFQDVTERASAERERERLLTELKRSNAELARFAYSVSHDLQQPTRTIRSLSDLLARRSVERPANGEKNLLEMIAGAADHMQKLISSLLRFAQVGEGELHLEWVDVGGMVESIGIALTSVMLDTGATLSCCGDLSRIRADRVQLERVLQNLIANAIQYSEPGVKPEVRITGGRIEGGWHIAISDNGMGIPPDRLEKVFEPLNRLNRTESAGTGLGLAMCRMIVNRHGGRIWAESEGLHRGSSFCIFLPSK